MVYDQRLSRDTGLQFFFTQGLHRSPAVRKETAEGASYEAISLNSKLLDRRFPCVRFYHISKNFIKCPSLALHKTAHRDGTQRERVFHFLFK